MPETAKVKNCSGESRTDAWSGQYVLDGQAIEVPLADMYAYTQQTEVWAPYDNGAKKAHKDATEARQVVDDAEVALYEARFGVAPPEPVTAETPVAEGAAVITTPEES